VNRLTGLRSRRQGVSLMARFEGYGLCVDMNPRAGWIDRGWTRARKWDVTQGNPQLHLAEFDERSAQRVVRAARARGETERPRTVVPRCVRRRSVRDPGRDGSCPIAS
jgi:hypothetical protein